MAYTIDRTFSAASFDEVTERTRKALADHGFGVLTEIDVAATMKKKLDVRHAELPHSRRLQSVDGAPGDRHRATHRRHASLQRHHPRHGQWRDYGQRR
jgi:hypothetical protein